MGTKEYRIVKSSLDRWVRDVAQRMQAQLGYLPPVAEIEDPLVLDKILGNSQACLVYQFLRLDDSPRAPRFKASFNVGVKTTDDGSNLQMADMLDEVQAEFKAEARFELMDYSYDPITGPHGTIMVVESLVSPQQFDKQSGIRMISCQAAVICHGR